MDATHRWLKASTELIGIDGKDAIPVERIFLGLASDTGKPIVAIGMASHENATENPEEEDQRARVRAERISSIAIRFFESQPEVRFVNLGARRSDIETNSALERRVAIMAIRCADEGVDLTRGIRNALEALHDRGELLFNPKAYHNWDANRFRVEVSSHGSGVRRVPSCNSAR
ncbi:MAG TPA: hypothetical protein VLK84_08470 [Longimicrobium sp.]|nr:hypothetical protein [Longimicrobium sp.]